MVVTLDAEELESNANHAVFAGSSPCLVVMPSTQLDLAQKAAGVILERAGIKCDVLVVLDSPGLGFINIVNAVADIYQGQFLVYCAQDAFPGMDFLKLGLNEFSKKPGLNLLAFNDGKWSGRIASFGMVRVSWARGLYGSGLFFHGYQSNGADVELSEIARAQNCLGYTPHAVLLEVDYNKGRRWTSNPQDTQLLSSRRAMGFPVGGSQAPVITTAANAPARASTLPKPPRIIVYTCNYSHYETIKEPLHINAAVQYLLFTDRDEAEIESNAWRPVRIKVDEPLNPRRFSRIAKILAHKVLPAHDISIYLDSSLTLNEQDLPGLAVRLLGDQDMALYRHFQRSCIYEEIEHCRALKLEQPQVCDATLRYLESIEYPRKNGLFENAFIVRRNTIKVAALNEYWWSLYMKGSQRDQFSLMPALQKTGVLVNPIELGQQFRTSPFLIWKKHNQTYQEEAKAGL